MPQITFTCNERDMKLIADIDELADRDDRSRSGMIVLLLQNAVKERNRKRKKDSTESHPANVGSGNTER
jgi:metal-responsive CopG/Arc/MetJ family transcriptional regulator